MSRLQPQQGYIVPPGFRDLVLLDMMELSGSTVAAAKLLNLSQPTVSRRFRAVCQDLQLQGDMGRPPGGRIQPTPCLRLLRRGICHHRWDSGALRLGFSTIKPSGLNRAVAVEWVPLRQGSLGQWPSLLRSELLDGVVITPDTLTSQEMNWAIHDLIEAENAGQVLLSRRHPKIQGLVTALLSGSARSSGLN